MYYNITEPTVSINNKCDRLHINLFRMQALKNAPTDPRQAHINTTAEKKTPYIIVCPPIYVLKYPGRGVHAVHFNFGQKEIC